MKKVSVILKRSTSLTEDKGFTLVELIIVMFIFIIVIIISAGAFEKIINSSSQMTKSAESNIEGVIGLEIMRTDLEHAGFGLPYAMPFVATFEESQVAADSLAKGIDPSDFNDNQTAASDPNKVPRAIQSKAAAGSAAGAWELERDYIVIKSTLIGMNTAATKWSYVEGAGNIKQWGNNNDLTGDDRVITLDALTRTLIGTDTSNFSYKVGDGILYPPPNQTTNYLVYGVSSDDDLRAPYNRADYYIKRPDDISPRCAKGTGTLYKAIMRHDDGGVTEYPLLDCVADMQVVYYVDGNPDSDVNKVIDPYNQDIFSNSSAEDIRKGLKEIRVYILTHEGKKDKSYSYPSNIVHVGETGTSLGSDYDLSLLDGIGSEWANYRWKQYKIVVTPRNL